jgi:hypothetical protein
MSGSESLRLAAAREASPHAWYEPAGSLAGGGGAWLGSPAVSCAPGSGPAAGMGLSRPTRR